MAQAVAHLFDRTPDPLIGRVVADRYRIVGHLGRGGMGVVYKVEHLRIGKLMAMKLLSGELSRNREVVRRFKREALAASRLGSVNTVQVWDFGHADGLTYLVMELVVGEDLGRVLKREGPLPFRRVAQIAAQVCNSMEEAHERGIVHRDLKPENILVLNPGQRQLGDLVKVLDFGLAKLHDDERSYSNEVTTTGAIVGTPFFMAPEQIRGEPVDGRTDIYGLGAVMYRAVTGVPPFVGPTPISVLTQHLTEPVIPPHERAPELNIPAEVSDIILKCLAKDPADRWASASELRDALVSWLEDVGVSGRFLAVKSLDSVTSREVRVSRSGQEVLAATRREVDAWDTHRRRVGLVLVLLAVLVVLGLVTFARSVGPTRTQSAGGRVAEEQEPDDTVTTANALAFGTTGRGYLGRRLGPGRPDVDVWSFEVSAKQSTVSLSLSPLPNVPLCLELISGPAPGARFCRERGRSIVIPALRVAAGRHWVQVTQDLGKDATVYENVSDQYGLHLADAEPEVEVEPNDTLASAQVLAPSQTVTGVLGWRDDRDMFCARAGDGPLRFVVDDLSPKGAPPLVLETTRDSARDRLQPGKSLKTALLMPGAPRCLTLHAEGDGDDLVYRVTLVSQD